MTIDPQAEMSFSELGVDSLAMLALPGVGAGLESIKVKPDNTASGDPLFLMRTLDCGYSVAAKGVD